MRFTKLGIDERNNVIPKGQYPFKVVKAEEKTSKAGNNMIALTLKVKNVLINDFLMSSLESHREKIYNFCLATGLEEIYENEQLDDYQCHGKEGWASIKIEKDNYGNDKNVVGWYIKKGKMEETLNNENLATQMQQSIEDDEIPF